MRRFSLSDFAARRLEEARLRLAHPEALIHLALLGLVSGLLAGAVIIGFRLLVESTQALMLPGHDGENYEALPWWARLLLPIGGGLAIGLLFRFAANGSYVLGVTKVLERMAYHQGRMQWRGFFLQFFGAAISLISGHSVGREGPHVYLGAASASLLGQRLDLPNNAIRTLVGCGAAAGIAASFNTPLAGVIFSLEVVMMEYTVSSFIPVILAAVAATVLSNLVFGARPAFDVAVNMGGVADIPLVLLLGLAAGTLAALFSHLAGALAAWGRPVAFWWRTGLAGVMLGLCGILVPQVMGIGYDTVNQALAGELLVGSLLLILAVKVFATSIAIGSGIPGGMIGPVLFMGAMLGGAFGTLSHTWFPGMDSNHAFFALIGMAAMMGASLQAPLAALTAMMELAHNPAIIAYGMLAIVAASLTSSQLFGKESLFIAALKANGMDYDTNPVRQAMRRVGVAGLMNRRFVRLDPVITREQATQALANGPDWVIINGPERPGHLMPAVDLAGQLERDGDEVHLLEIPAQRLQLKAIHHQATLQEALDVIRESGAEALYVQQSTVPGLPRIYGILTRGRIESAYSL